MTATANTAADALNIARQVLIRAEHALVCVSGLHATDRPDLGLSPQTSWVIDEKDLIDQVGKAISAINAAGLSPSSNTHNTATKEGVCTA